MQPLRGPQGWAQERVHPATWLIFIQFIVVCIAGVATGEKAKSGPGRRG